MLAPLIPQSGSFAPYKFQFLNVCKTFAPGKVDWRCHDMPKLWRYNLHYFDYLHDERRPAAEKSALIDDWIENNPLGAADAWEPYTVSLRIVNWIKWFLTENAQRESKRAWLESLHLQAAWLEKNIEYHLLANHYLKNGKALLFAGAYFSGPRATRWLKKGLAILRREASEQILADGGHYERSPMYHSIVVEDYLDVLNISSENPELVESRVAHRLREKTVAALEFLNEIVAPDGEIPLFNDSAFGIAARPEQLFDYARRILGYQRSSLGDALYVGSRPNTGYYTIRDGESMLIIDCGPIGPDYQPGHAHCDTLSYELYLGGRRVVADAGVYDYERSDAREYARSTRAHNTVMVNGQEQSEIWGVFRVARRARPVEASIELVDQKHAVFQGSHDGYQRLHSKVTHHRRVNYEATTGWTITDELQGSGRCYLESFVHLAPDQQVAIDVNNGQASVRDAEGVPVADMVLPDNLKAEIISGHYFPEFGVDRTNSVIRLYGEAKLPFHTHYRINERVC